MKGKSALFWLGLTAAAGVVLFQTSYEVQELEEQLASVNRKIVQEQEAIQILKAEWSFLNDPARLESLARAHLALKPTEARQFVALDLLPMRPVALPDDLPAPSPLPDAPQLVPAPLPPMAGLNGGTVVPASLKSAPSRPAAPAVIKAVAPKPAESKPAKKAVSGPVEVASRPASAPVQTAQNPAPALRPGDSLGALVARLEASR
jgi:cell division protein FtsL